MKIATPLLLGATPAALEYGWLLASLQAAQASTPAAHAHAAHQATARDPRAALLDGYAADKGLGGSFNARIAGLIGER